MAKNEIGRPRKFKTPDILWDKWIEYKQYCDDYTKPRTEFSQRLGEFFTKYVPSPITYTITGFCSHNSISIQAFDETYKHDEAFLETISRMYVDCETDARRKFELGLIDTRLVNLWMSNHNYKLPAQQQDDSGIAEAINKLDEVLNKITIGSGEPAAEPQDTD